jgi:hypothetical protein
MTRKEGLAALRVVLNPDAKVMSASPYHPAFTTLISSAAFVRWQPSAYDQNKVAGRFHTEGMQQAFRKWGQAPISNRNWCLSPFFADQPNK